MAWVAYLHMLHKKQIKNTTCYGLGLTPHTAASACSRPFEGPLDASALNAES